MATRNATKKPRTSRTKADIESAFSEISNTHAARETLDPQAELLARERATTVRDSVAGLSVDKIVQNAAALGLNVQRTLNDLTEQCVAKANELKMLQEAVALEASELDRLYDLDVASASIQLLIEAHEEKKYALEKQMGDLHAAWNEEQANHEKQIRLRNQEVTEARKREEDAYNYNKSVERNRAEDEFQRQLAAKKREMHDKEVLFNRDIEERRAAIAKEEQEIAALKARVASIETEIKSAVDREVAIVTRVLKKDHEHETTLLKKDYEAKLQLEMQRNANLSENNKVLAERIMRLEAEVKAAHDKVAETAKSALESASGQSALSAIKETLNNNSNGSASRGGKA